MFDDYSYTSDQRNAQKAYKALMVISQSPHIRKFLEENDPKALEQVEDAADAVYESDQYMREWNAEMERRRRVWLRNFSQKK